SAAIASTRPLFAPRISADDQATEALPGEIDKEAAAIGHAALLIAGSVDLMTGFAKEARKPSMRSTMSLRQEAGIAASHSVSGMPPTNAARSPSAAAFQLATFNAEAGTRLRMVMPVPISRRAARMLKSAARCQFLSKSAR